MQHNKSPYEINLTLLVINIYHTFSMTYVVTEKKIKMYYSFTTVLINEFLSRF